MIQTGFVNRRYALARFFVTFLTAFFPLPAARTAALRIVVFELLEAGLAAFRTVLTAFFGVLAPLPADLEAFLAAGLARLAACLAALAFFSDLASTAPIAARIRLISRVTCSMVIMPSTVSSLRRSE